MIDTDFGGPRSLAQRMDLARHQVELDQFGGAMP